jgi:signal transduction histidine kinase
MPDPKPSSTVAPRRAPVRPRRTRATRQDDAGATEGFFRDLVWGLRNGLLAILRDGTVTVMNDVAYQILGLERTPSDVGKPFKEVLQNQQEVCRIVASAFELSHLPNRAEMRLKNTGKVIGYTLSQVRNSRGEITGAALFFKDLTRVEQLEERERLRDRLAALGEMAAAIAHEVKNPLAGIEVMAGILKRQLADSPDAQSILGDIIKEAKMANAIVLEVLDFVRPIRLQVENISIADAIRDAVALAEGHVPRGDVRITVACADNLPAIQGDPHQLRQIFTNLLMNAFEALNGDGVVKIAATALNEEGPAGSSDAQGPMVQVEVTDNGPGMPAEVLEKIFSPFFTTKPQGSGLGLAIVRKIVDAHDGRIDVGVLDTGGTRFRVTLPVTGSHQLFG